MKKVAGMNRIRLILTENRTLHEMLIGILVSNFVIALIGVIVSSQKVQALLGVLFGMMIACFYVIHMAVTLDDALCLDEKGASTEIRKNMLIRYFVTFVVAGCVCYFKWGNPVLCILSILTIKTGAYLQPVIHKLINGGEDK